MSFKDFLHMLFRNEIIRRYVVINSFDGALTVLGIIFAYYFAGITDPKLIILPGIGAAIALFISGVWSAYVSEKSESKRSILDLEKHLLSKISHTKIGKKAKESSIFVALANGLSPSLAILIALLPFILAQLSIISLDYAYYISFSLIAITLFMIGAFTGIVSKENIIKKGIIMLFAGVVIGIIFYVLAMIGLL